MLRKRLLWQFYFSYLLLLIIFLTGTLWFNDHEWLQFHLQQTSSDLVARCRMVEEQLARAAPWSDPQKLDALCKSIGQASGSRVTIVLANGKVAGDTQNNPATMDNHADRPEIKAALQGQIGSQIRHSDTLNFDMMYVAIPLYESSRVRAIIRTAVTLDGLQQPLDALYRKIALGVLICAAVAAVICFYTARRMARPLEELKDGVEKFAAGELQHQLFVSGTDEIGQLAAAMNQMASELDSRIRMVVRQRNEQAAVLAGMSEGVLAVDREERIIRLNPAMEKLLETEEQKTQGRFMQEVVHNPELQLFIKNTLNSQLPTEGDIVWRDEEDRYFQVRGNLLRDAQGEPIGAVVVLNEITRLYNLERVRRDFVANVSHELKTPITSIRGFSEILLDNSPKEEGKARHYLDIIFHQSTRLNALVDDLLSLARIEKQAEESGMVLTPEPVRPIVEAAVQACELSATEHGIKVDFAAGDEVRARICPENLERAIINLIDNAIKYSPGNTMITLTCEANEQNVLISVRDQGCGIAKEHLPRLFERFYRVDKSRSKEVGGTGLGLAIVKHIVLAHKGTVQVSSQPGQGSTFTIILPKN